MTDTNILNLQTSLYIPEIQKLEFHILRVRILGTNQCGDSCQTSNSISPVIAPLFGARC